MRRSELEHILRPVAAITNEYEIVVVGSQSLLGAVPEPYALLVESMEADVYPLHRPHLADLIGDSFFSVVTGFPIKAANRSRSSGMPTGALY